MKQCENIVQASASMEGNRRRAWVSGPESRRRQRRTSRRSAVAVQKAYPGSINNRQVGSGVSG